MSLCEIYHELKGWQNLIGSVLGFLFLILGALYNFRLNRRRDDLMRADEARSVLAALYGEILLLREEVGDLARIVAGTEVRYGTSRQEGVPFDEHFVRAYGLSEPVFYGALASKIGLIEPDLVISITEFHRNYQEAKKWLPLLVDTPDRRYGYFVSAVLRPACDAVNNVEPALKKIEAILSVNRPAKEIDLGYTPDVMEREHDICNTPLPD